MDHGLQNDPITKQNFKQVAYYTIVIRRLVDTLLERRNTIMTFIYTLRSRKKQLLTLVKRTNFQRATL